MYSPIGSIVNRFSVDYIRKIVSDPCPSLDDFLRVRRIWPRIDKVHKLPIVVPHLTGLNCRFFNNFCGGGMARKAGPQRRTSDIRLIVADQNLMNCQLLGWSSATLPAYRSGGYEPPVGADSCGGKSLVSPA